MTLANASTLRYSVRRNNDVAADDQVLQVRLCYCSRLISRSPSIGLPYDILAESELSQVKDAMFRLPLRELEDPLLCHNYVVQLLSSTSFKLPVDKCNPIAKKISSFVAETAARDYDAKFQLDVDIDWIQVFWEEEKGSSARSVKQQGKSNSVRGLYVEEVVVLEPVGPPIGSPRTIYTMN